MNNRVSKISFIGIATALAMVLSYLENLLPPIWSTVPGIKLGLPNFVIIFVLYKISWRAAAGVSLVRILLTALLFGNPMTLAYSMAGAFLSLLIMSILKKTNIFSIVGVSITGGVLHNVGQIIMAMIILQTKELGYYMAVLLISGTVAGALIGIAAAFALKYFEKIKFSI